MRPSAAMQLVFPTIQMGGGGRGSQGSGRRTFADAKTADVERFRRFFLTRMLLGMLTGIGGGILRDVLVAEVPAVLRGDVYAVAALAGAAVVVGGRLLQVPSGMVAIVGALVCFAIRFAAIKRGWQLPVARSRDGS